VLPLIKNRRFVKRGARGKRARLSERARSVGGSIIPRPFALRSLDAVRDLSISSTSCSHSATCYRQLRRPAEVEEHAGRCSLMTAGEHSRSLSSRFLSRERRDAAFLYRTPCELSGFFLCRQERERERERRWLLVGEPGSDELFLPAVRFISPVERERERERERGGTKQKNIAKFICLFATTISRNVTRDRDRPRREFRPLEAGRRGNSENTPRAGEFVLDFGFDRLADPRVVRIPAE